MNEQTDTPPVADETTDPAITHVLHALTDQLHESLCNCKAYPASCVSRSHYRRDDLVWTLTHADAALEEALKQGWTPPAEITDAAVKDVADAIEAAYRRGCLNWNAEARAAIAAYLPHQAAERDAENTRLNGRYDELAIRCNAAEEQRDDARADVAEYAETLKRIVAERDAETTALRAELEEAESRLAQIWGLVQKTAGRGGDLPADANEQVLDLTNWNSSTPAPTTTEEIPSV